jgi:NAD(P)-dependent dehydrogenase (short-subunit alcohol dehydrogenase family)
MDTQPLHDQVALVTGGGRGIGQVIASALATAGANVAVAARSTDQLTATVASIEQAGGRALAVPLDVTNQEAVDRAVHIVEQQIGPVDLLVNNAGVSGPVGTLWEIDPVEWWETLEVNLRGAFLCSRAVLPAMIRRGRGRIVNVASSAGLRPWPLISAYAVSKAALLHFTENLAKETRGRGVYAFAIHPGIVRLGMVARALEMDPAPESPEGQIVAWFHEQVTAGRDVPPERSAQLVVELASGRADRLSGRYIDVDDDLASLLQRVDEIEAQSLYTLRLRSLSAPSF